MLKFSIYCLTQWEHCSLSQTSWSVANEIMSLKEPGIERQMCTPMTQARTGWTC